MGKWLKILVTAIVGAVVIIVIDGITGFQKNPALAQVPHDVAHIVMGGIFANIIYGE